MTTLTLPRLLLKPVLAAALLALAPSLWAAKPVYRIEPLPLGDTFRPVAGLSINNRGDVVGEAVRLDDSDMPVHFLYRDGQMKAFGGVIAMYSSINRRGESAGYAGGAAAWADADGVVHNINDELGCLGSNSWSGGINDAGVVVGFLSCYPAAGRAFVYRDGKAVYLQGLAETGTVAEAVNNSGQVVGSSSLGPKMPSHAVLWQRDGSVQDLGTLGGDESAARAVNDKGQVVGMADDARGIPVPFIHDGVSMRALPACRDGSITPVALNDHGTVVGISGMPGRASVIEAGRCHVLNALLDESGADWQFLGAAYDINDRGQIVGDGRYKGENRAFIATPLRSR